MATLTHEHPLLKDQDSSHVDNWSRKFGGAEHEALKKNVEFNVTSQPTPNGPVEVTLPSNPIKHKHRHIEEVVDGPTKLRSWRYRPPSREEEEREIDDTLKPTRRVPVPVISDDDDEDFVD